MRFQQNSLDFDFGALGEWGAVWGGGLEIEMRFQQKKIDANSLKSLLVQLSPTQGLAICYPKLILTQIIRIPSQKCT